MRFKRIVFRVWEVHLNYWFKLSCAFRYQCDRSNLLILSVAQNHYIKNLIHGFLVSIVYFSVSKLPSYFLQNSNNNNNNNVPFQLVSFSTKLSDFLEDVSPGGLQVVLHTDTRTHTHTHTHTHISTILHNNPTNHSALCYLQTLSLLMAFLGHLRSRLWSPKHETSLVAQMVKHLLTMKETQVQSLGWEDLLEREMATHSSILGWKIP